MKKTITAITISIVSTASFSACHLKPNPIQCPPWDIYCCTKVTPKPIQAKLDIADSPAEMKKFNDKVGNINDWVGKPITLKKMRFFGIDGDKSSKNAKKSSKKLERMANDSRVEILFWVAGFKSVLEPKDKYIFSDFYKGDSSPSEFKEFRMPFIQKNNDSFFLSGRKKTAIIWGDCQPLVWSPSPEQVIKAHLFLDGLNAYIESEMSSDVQVEGNVSRKNKKKIDKIKKTGEIDNDFDMDSFNNYANSLFNEYNQVQKKYINSVKELEKEYELNPQDYDDKNLKFYPYNPNASNCKQNGIYVFEFLKSDMSEKD